MEHKIAETNARIDVADVLRGLAVMGIILLHSIEHFNFYSFPEEVHFEWMKFTDQAIWRGLFFTFSNKAYAVFALLFGFSFYIQDNNQQRRGKDFRRQYEENEKYNLTSITSQPDVTGLILYRPTRGMVSDHFNAEKKHYGTDIAANPNESVLATMDGTVILSTYTAETGYLIGVQHNQDLISIYKHCGSLLKKEGERVKGGEAIALVGNSGTLSTGPHLHFELWYKGHPVNPEKYIVF